MMTPHPPTVLVVDDTPDKIDVLSGLLQERYTVKAAINGKTALAIAARDPQPDLILLDVMMPEMDGYEVCRQLKADPLTAPIPVIFITSNTEIEDDKRGFDLGAVDFVTWPVSPPIVLARINTHLALYDQSRHLDSLVAQRTAELQHTRLEIIRRLGRAAEYKDNQTGMHVIRVSWYCRFIAEAAGLPEDWCELLFNAAPMHDIGKIGIPERVLLKPGKLDAEEWAEMMKHSEYGAEMIGDHESSILRLAREIALHHHEKWDGSGYPHGMRGEDIPLSARIVAIADVFDSLTSERPYKKAWPEEQAIELLERESGRHFDPSLVPLFIGCLPRVREVQARFSDHATEA